MPTPPDSTPPSRGQPTSRWAKAITGDHDAMRALSERYWYPVFAWWRRAGFENAGALAQASFSRWLTDSPPNKEQSGADRFREWLLASLNGFPTEDSGPVAEPVITIPREEADGRYKQEPEGTPDEILQRGWALTVLTFAMDSLHAEYAGGGREALYFEALPFASFEDSDDERYRQLASRMGFSAGAARKAVFEFRTRHRELVREFVADTLADSTDLESELTILLCSCNLPSEIEEKAPQPFQTRSLKPDELLARALRTVQMTVGAEGHFTPPTDHEVAHLFPQYEMLGLLGRGGMGAVYKARQTSLDRCVAIKLLPLEISVDREFADRFRREARAMAKLNHPNITGVYDFGQTTEGHLYFVMEFVDGLMLHDLIHQFERLAPTDALAYVEQICGALAFAHEKGIVHRDIKPTNIMIAKGGEVKVADFGLARLTDATDVERWGSTLTGQVIGTPDYMSPEQKRGLTTDSRSDIYAVGVLIYEALCGETPQGAFEPLSKRIGADKRMDAIITKALASQPDARFQSATELRLAIAAVRPAFTKGQGKKPRVTKQENAVASFGRVRSSYAPLYSVVSVFLLFAVLVAVYRLRNPPTPIESGPFPAAAQLRPVEIPESTSPPTPALEPTPQLAPAITSTSVDIFPIFTSSDYIWQKPKPLGGKVDGAKVYVSPTLSDDGLLLIFSASRASGKPDLYESSRKTVDEPFGPAEAIWHSEDEESGPFMSGDGLTLLYHVSRGLKHEGLLEIYLSRRNTRDERWGKPKSIGAVNVKGAEAPCLSRDGLTILFHSKRPGGRGGYDLWRSHRTSQLGTFDLAENLGRGLNSPSDEESPALGPDDATILFIRQDEKASFRLMIAKLDAHAEFKVFPVDPPLLGSLQSPTVSNDGLTLYFAASTSGNSSGWELWEATRLHKTHLP